MTKLILLYLLIINAIGFLLMLADKQNARKNLWRIPESTLFTAAAFGGSIGCLIGMYTVRHKTKHWTFVLGMPAILIAQIALVVWLLTM
jgi:uncharacterized membrane protein YsdA (DUF1294 family)